MNKVPLAKCDKCPLANAPVTPTCGPENAKVAIVSRSPGYYETKHGEPFSGPSGKVVNHLLEQNGHKREDTLLTNVVLCETNAPPLKAIHSCSERLKHDLRKADTIIAAGSEAAKAVIGASSLSGSRGYAHERYASDNGAQRVIVTNNPAIVLKDDSTFPNLVRDFKLALNPLPAPKLPEVHWTNEIHEAKRWIQQIVGFDRLFCDIESRGLAHTASIASFAISASGHRALAFGDQVLRNNDFVERYLRRLLELEDIAYVWHNGKFDVRNLRDKRINARVDDDTLLLSYALDERSDEDQVHSLDYLLMNELNWPHYEPEIVKKWKATVGKLERELRFDELEALETPDELYEYNALDAAGTALLYPILHSRAIDDGVYDYYRNFLLRDSTALIDVELRGMNYDYHKAADINENEVLPELDRLREEMRWIIGDGNYNPNSAKQNAELVYDKWRIIHNIDRGEDKERSVDKAVYTEIKAGRFFIGMGQSNTIESGVLQGTDDFQEIDDEVIGGLIAESDLSGRDDGSDVGLHSEIRETATRWAERFADFKALDKQRSTYIEGLIGRAENAGGRIYSDFKLHSTVTGRPSSSRPNLQNVTRPKEGLPNIRSLFVASPGCVIVSADYSQAELRTIAQLSGDKRLSAIYETGESLHKRVAERFYGPAYTGEQYTNCKNMNFGVCYGQSAETFQAKHDVPISEGEEFIKWFFREFPGVKAWRQATAREVLKEGFIQSPFGHKRRFHLVTHENKGGVIREAINFRPQHIAARLTLWAMTELVELGLPVINEVHDSIILDVPVDDVHETCLTVEAVMRKAPSRTIGWDMPFEVEIKIGKSWGELEDI